MDSKLENVKKCITTFVSLLKSDDTCSLITFGDSSEIILDRAKCDESSKESIRCAIHEFNTSGSTNLSAGLLNVKKVVQHNEKAGLLLLTDGHANQGVCNSAGLISIFKTLVEQFPRLSISSIGYGTDHNSDLLKTVAEETQGKYAIVDSIENTAFAFGDILGGIMSCYAQLTTLKLPPNSKIHGPYTIKKDVVYVGDIYAGTQILLLLDVPTHMTGDVTVCATILPGLEQFEKKLNYSPLLENSDSSIEIALTRLRFECSELLKLLRNSVGSDSSSHSTLKTRVDAFESALANPTYASHPITQTLKNEIPIMREALNGGHSRALDSVMSQHETSIGLGRGFSSPVRPMRVRNGPPRINRVRVPSMDMEDMFMSQNHSLPSPIATNEEPTNESAFQNRTMMSIASALRNATQNPGGV
jgi:hypothetical protein